MGRNVRTHVFFCIFLHFFARNCRFLPFFSKKTVIFGYHKSVRPILFFHDMKSRKQITHNIHTAKKFIFLIRIPLNDASYFFFFSMSTHLIKKQLFYRYRICNILDYFFSCALNLSIIRRE